MRALRAAAAAAAVAAAAPATAYVRTTSQTTGAPLFWPMPVVPYQVNPAHPFSSPTCEAGPGGDPALDAVRAGFAAWAQPCADLRLVDAGPIDEIRVGQTGTQENVVVFRQGFCSQHPQAKNDPCMTDPEVDCGNLYDCFEDSGAGDRFIVALTSVLYEPRTGRILDADVELNGWDGAAGSVAPGGTGPAHGWYFTCDDQPGWSACAQYGQGGCYYIDLQNTVTHEVGHFLGLAHVCETSQGTCTPAMQGLTMYPATFPGDLEKRTLAEDDIAGVCAIYPEKGGGCGCGAGGAPGAIAALLAAAALWPRRRRGSPAAPGGGAGAAR